MRRLQSLALSSSAWMDSAAYGSRRHKHKVNKYSIWAPLLKQKFTETVCNLVLSDELYQRCSVGSKSG